MTNNIPPTSIPVIVSNQGRQPVSGKTVGTGLNAQGQPKQPALAVISRQGRQPVNPKNR